MIAQSLPFLWRDYFCKNSVTLIDRFMFYFLVHALELVFGWWHTILHHWGIHSHHCSSVSYFISFVTREIIWYCTNQYENSNLIAFYRHFKVASSLLIAFMVSSWATTGFIAYQNNHIPNTDDPLALFDKIYDKPWTRLGPYMVGMCVGWFLFETKKRYDETGHKFQMSRVSNNSFAKWSSFNLYWWLHFFPIFPVTILDHIGCWLVFGQFLFALVDLWSVQRQIGYVQCRCLQFIEPLCMGHEFGMDRCGLFIRIWRICEPNSISTRYLSILTCHILCIFGASNCNSLRIAQFGRHITFGQRLNGNTNHFHKPLNNI